MRDAPFSDRRANLSRRCARIDKEAKAATKNDVWLRALPVNIDAWFGVRQLAKNHKPAPLVAVKTPTTTPTSPVRCVAILANRTTTRHHN